VIFVWANDDAGIKKIAKAICSASNFSPNR
jgi:hypothetical protein